MYRIIATLVRRPVCCRNRRMFHVVQNVAKYDIEKCNSCLSRVLVQHDHYVQTVKRFKSKKKKKVEEDDESSEDEDNEGEEEEYDKSGVPDGVTVIKNKLNSLRLDNVAKLGWKMQRAKVDEAFYAGKIRLNGEKVLKKSITVNVDDEIDYVHGFSPDNPTLLKITRTKLLATQPTGNGIRVTVTREFNLLIENYTDPWVPME